MKRYLIFAIGLCSTMLNSGLVLAEQAEAKKELLSDIKAETKKCAVRQVGVTDGASVVSGYRSTCPSLKIKSMSQAEIFIDGEWFQVKIVESVLSDGGDLDDLYVSNFKGQIVAQRLNIPAYDSVIVAMAGTADLIAR